MKAQWSDRKRKIVAFIAVNLGMLGGFIVAAFLVPGETKLRTFGWICTTVFVLGNVLLGLKLKKPRERNPEFNVGRLWLFIGLSLVAATVLHLIRR